VLDFFNSSKISVSNCSVVGFGGTGAGLFFSLNMR